MPRRLFSFAVSSSRRSASLISTLLVGAALPWILPLPSVAAPVEWNASAGGDFNTPANWNPASVPGPGDTALFNIALSGAVTLSADASPGSISFDTNATGFALGALGGNTITTANGGAISILATLTAANQTFTLNAPLVLTPDSATTPGTFTIQNNGTSASSTLVIAGGISSGTTTATETLTLGGANTGNNLVSGDITNGTASALALVKSGAGTWTLSGANTYTGGTSIAGGTLVLSGGNNRLPTTGTLAFTGTSGTLDVGSTTQSVSGLTFLIAGTNSNVITGAGGTLSVTGGSVHVGGGSNTSTGSNATTVSMTGLSNFNYTNTGGTFSVGGRADVGTSVSGAGTLSMATVNTITAANFLVSPVSSGNSSPNTGIVHLGLTNTINANTFTVGVGKATSLLDFQNLTSPTLKIRGTAGTDAARAAVTVGVNDSGVVAGNATVDLTSGGTVTSTLDAMISTLMIGQNTRNLTAGFASTGTFIMGLGTMNATTIVIGQQNAVTGSNSTGAATGTLSLNGGTITATTLTLANKLATATAQAITSNFNLYSGTLNATTIQRGTAGTGAGANTATINFNWVDGTISNIAGTNQTVNGNTAVNGLTSGLNIVLNNTGNVSGTHTWNVSGGQTATVQDTVTLSGAGSLTKSGTGMLVLGGANSYSGTTTVNEGTLRFGLRSALYNGNTPDWTAANLVVNAGATAAFNVGGAGEFTSTDIDLLKSLGTNTGGFKSGSFLGLDTTNASGGSFSYGSVIANPNGGLNTLGLVKFGTGTLVLTEASTHTGGTSIAEGTLALSGGDNRLLSTGALRFTGSTGTLNVGSTTQTVGTLTFPSLGTTSSTISGATGTLNVTGGNIQIGGGNSTSASSAQTVDMSGLGIFNYTNTTGSFNVGGLTDFTTASTTGSGTLTLAATNTITAASFNISPYTTGQSSLNSGVVHLGQTNTINASTVLIGNQKTTALLDFQNLVNPTLKIRGTGGRDTDRASITVGTNNSGITASVSTVDLTNGGTISSTLDAMVSTLMIGQNLRNATGLGLASTGTFTMGDGTLNATSIILGQQAALTGANTFSGAATGTLNLNGGTITATTFTLADKLSGAAVQTITSNFNLYSGTLEAGTIQRGAAGTGAGADTATINFNWVDGTLSNIAGANQTVSGNTAVNGLTGGLNIVLNNTGNTSGTHTWNVSGAHTATVQSTVTVSGNGGLTKTGDGTLVFTGVNSYTGQTNVNAGELQLNATGGTAVGGDLTINSGTVRLLQANQITSTKSLVVNSGTFNLQGFNQTLANVRLTGGGSITSSTGVLTSTTAFDLQSGSVGAILAGTAGVVKSTSSTVVLSRANTFSGGVQVNGGTLIAGISGALGANNALSIASGTTFAYRPVSAGALNLGTGALTVAGGSTIGTALAGTLGQSAITSSAAATASGAIKVDIYGGTSVTAGTQNLLTVASGLTSGGATYSLGVIYNATNFTVSGFQATDTALRITATAATALTNAYWKGGLGGASNVWAVSDGTASNWVTNANGTGATPLTPGTEAILTFSATGATNQGAMVLGANMSVRNLVVNDPAGITLNADGNTLTIVNAAGIAVNSGAGAVTLNAPLILGVAQTWTNNSTSLLTIGGAVNNNTFALTVNGSGRTTLSGTISGTGGLTKSGTGTLSLSGVSTYTGSTSVNGGALNISNSFASSTINVANAGSSTGILNVQPGASLNLTGGNSFIIGAGSASAGAMYQSGGTILMAGQLNLGLGGTVSTPAYGFYSISGGSLNDTGSSSVRYRVGGGGSGAMGVLYQTGGSININYGNGLEVGANATGGFSNATGVAYLTGGTLTALSNRIGYNNTTGSAGGVRGEQTVDADAVITINGSTMLAQAAGDIGILNLNGGIYATRQIARGNASGVSILNLNGGMLRAASSAIGTFLTGLTSANVYAGGVTFDTNGQNLNIGQSLLAPAGDGVATIPVTNGGSGYVGAPIITISGGGGTGATAVANMVDDGTGNGTFKIASITITSAGTGYTGAPTVDMIGGGGTGAILGTAATAANLSGGITKTGTGTLTLGGTNTYTGATVVEAGGALAASSTSAFGVNSAATVDGTLRLNGRDNALGSLAGSGVVDNSNATAATVTVGGDNTSTTFSGSLQNGTGGALSVVKTGSGVQTFTGASTYTGATTISQGTLQVGTDGIGSLAAGSAVAVNGSSATLAGTGLVNGVVTATSGFIRPGDGGGSATGTLTTGGLNLTAGGTATLQIEGASSFDHLTVLNPGGLTLDGRLVVTTSLTGPAFDAAFAAGTTFDLLDWEGALGGSFNAGTTIRDGSADNGLQFDLPDLSSLSRFWDVSSFLSTGTIVVVVPEPGRAMLLMLALGTLAFRRRRTPA